MSDWRPDGSLNGVPLYVNWPPLDEPDTRTVEQIAVAAAMHVKRMEQWPKKLNEYWKENLKADIAI